jgi:hypothetical protein
MNIPKRFDCQFAIAAASAFGQAGGWSCAALGVPKSIKTAGSVVQRFQTNFMPHNLAESRLGVLQFPSANGIEHP